MTPPAPTPNHIGKDAWGRLTRKQKTRIIRNRGQARQLLASFNTMINTTLTSTAHDLLTIHNGACSVREDSRMGRAMRELEKQRRVIIIDGGTPGYIDVRRIPRPAPDAERHAELREWFMGEEPRNLVHTHR